MEDYLTEKHGNADLSKIAGLQQKRTLAFVNHFMLANVQSLNNFMKNCDHKLMLFERKLEKVNAAMVLLEAKLSSIPELDIPSNTILEPKENENIPIEKLEPTNQEDTKVEREDAKVDIEENKPEILPEYEKFLKMVQVGVPLQAVKLKASLEGLDPNILERILGN